MSEQLPLTPSQTVGPYLRLGLDWPKGADVVPPGTPGEIVISGIVYDGAGVPITDGLIETWQADPDGRFAHPDDPRGAAEPSVPGFLGFGRLPGWLRGLRETEPGIEVVLREATTDVQLRALELDEADAGFVLHAPGIAPEGTGQKDRKSTRLNSSHIL